MHLPMRSALTTFLVCVSVTVGLGCGDDETDDEGAGGELVLGELDITGRFPTEVANGFVLHDLGVMDTTDGETQDFTFEATTETRAFYVVGVSHPETFVVPLHAVAPDGTVFIASNAEVSELTENYLAGVPGPPTSQNKAIVRPGGAAALIPNTPKLAMQAGTWSLRVGVFHVRFDADEQAYDNGLLDTEVHVGIVERVVDPPAEGTIDLALFFGPEMTVDAGSAPEHPSIVRALERIDESLATVGVRVGDVRYEDAPDVPAIVDLHGPSCLGGPELLDALASAPDDSARIRIVFAPQFRCVSGLTDIGQNLAGVSNGVPGVPFVPRDGIMVSTLLMDEYPEDWAGVLAHELGHYLGLFHTCEPESIGLCDNIADTDEGPGALDNLMYFNVTEATGDALSPDQGTVIRMSPFLRAAPDL